MTRSPLVFEDPFAVPILPPDARAELQRTPAASRKPFSAALRAFMVCRARFAEDVLAAGVRHRGVRQALILGAGLDTFALRNPYPNLRVFEVDHPATQSWKCELLAASKLAVPATLTHVPVDFERQSLRQQLLQDGFDFTVPTATAWLGVVPYLTHGGLRRHCARSRPSARRIQPGLRLLAAARSRCRSPNSSCSTRFRPASRWPASPSSSSSRHNHSPRSLHRYNLTVVEDLDSDGLNTRYLANRPDGLHLRGKAGRLCHAEVLLRDDKQMTYQEVQTYARLRSAQGERVEIRRKAVLSNLSVGSGKRRRRDSPGLACRSFESGVGHSG